MAARAFGQPVLVVAAGVAVAGVAGDAVAAERGRTPAYGLPHRRLLGKIQRTTKRVDAYTFAQAGRGLSA